MINKWNEIPVNEKQWHSSFYTEGGDDHIRCFSNNDSFFSKRAVTLCALFGHALAKHLKPVQRHQCLFCLTVMPVIPNTLENFEDDQISHGNDAFDDPGIERAGVFALNAIKVVDPDTGIDQYQTKQEVLVLHPRLRVYIMHAGYPMLDDLLVLMPRVSCA